MTQKNWINCFSVRAGAPTREGVPFAEGVAIDVHTSPATLTLGSKRTVSVLSRYLNPGLGLLLRAETHRGPSGPALVSAKDAWRGIILHVQCRGLRFDIEPYANGLNLWTGGDGPIDPFVQYYNPEDKLAREQIFSLKHGEFIYVIDERRAVGKITCINGEPVISRPGLEELVEFLVSREKRGVRAVDWALHNLRTLSRTKHGRNRVVVNELARMNRVRERLR